MGYTLQEVTPLDHSLDRQVNELLEREGIERDRNLDYTCALVDEDGRPVATGSCFGSTLRCFAVASSHQGEGLLNQIVSHLTEHQLERGNTHLFLYTKVQSTKFFRDLGFYEIARAEDKVVFMENRREGFARYLDGLRRQSPPHEPGQRIGAVVLNANPFTLGHRYLVEQASSRCDLVHVFVVSEDASLVPFAVRDQLVREGSAHLRNLVYHETGPYLISANTFPSYFLKEETAVSEGHARLDAAVFACIAQALDIRCRFVGEETSSQVTGIYNRVMDEELPQAGVECVELPRIGAVGQIVSASTVRQLIKEDRLEEIRPLVPDSTWRYFSSAQAKDVIRAIQQAGDVVHH